MCSHLARNSEVYFDSLKDFFSADRLGSLLLQLNSVVRAKTCNLIGNLCRHSDSWYSVLKDPVRVFQDKSSEKEVVVGSLLSLLIDCCADADSSTRKFACFAVGNAAFHSSELYIYLGDSISALLSALDDSDEKTRANSVGALGNLVRNGPDLAGDLCISGAVDRLLVMCLKERVVFPQVLRSFVNIFPI